jgi:uncharacterized repeat protein (TIGR02543 family)
MLLTAAFTLPLAAGTTEEAYAATDGDYEYSVSGGKATITKYNGAGGDISIPSALGGYPVTAIGKEAFAGLVYVPENGYFAQMPGSWITSVTIPSSVKSIGERAFTICSSLKTVTIQDGVTSIRKSAFEECESLESAAIPNSVTSLGNRAFSGCKSLKSITIPNGVTSIEEWVFDGCKSLKSITIPKNVKSIGNYAFSSTSLKSVTIPKNVKSIGDYAFTDCKSLKSVTISNGVKSIGEFAFEGTSLKSVTIPKSVKSMGSDAFYSKSLKSVTFKDGVNARLSGGAFLDCKSLSVTIESGKIKQNAFIQCEFLKSVIIQNGVKSIGGWAFAECKSLKSVTIQNGAKSIGESAFNSCKSLKSITIPKSVRSIGKTAFNSCKSLKSITIPKSVKSIGTWAFYDCPKLKLKVFKNSYAHKYLKDYNLKFSFIKSNYKATFNANKGKVSGKAKFVKKVKPYAKLGKLKTPKRAGYTFKGWYTKKSGGTKIKASTWMYAQNVTYYAQWKKKA